MKKIVTKLHPDLQKRFKDNSIAITDKNNNDLFLWQNSPSVVIEIAHYILKSNPSLKKVEVNLLKKTLQIDVVVRTRLFYLIRKIEDKFTGTLINDISITNGQFHLQDSNFKNFKAKGKNTKSYFKKVLKHFNMQIKLSKELAKSLNVDQEQISYEKVLQQLSFGQKLNNHFFAQEKFKSFIYIRWNMNNSSQEKQITDSFLRSLKVLRNKVSHHECVLDFQAYILEQKLDIFEFISLISFFASKKEFAKAKSSIFPKVKLPIEPWGKKDVMSYFKNNK